MRFSLTREVLLKPLQQVVSVVEKRQTMPVLSNLLVVLEQGTLSLTATDLEVELVARVGCSDGEPGAITIRIVTSRRLSSVYACRRAR